MTVDLPSDTSKLEINMKSFPFWLSIAAALGAVAGTILRPGVPEIVIVWVLVAGLYYATRNMRDRSLAS